MKCTPIVRRSLTIGGALQLAVGDSTVFVATKTLPLDKEDILFISQFRSLLVALLNTLLSHHGKINYTYQME